MVLESEGLRYQPDLVIWSYVPNDPAHPVFDDANGKLGRYFYEPRSYTLHFIKKKLFRASERRKRAKCGHEYHARLNQYEGERFDPWHPNERGHQVISDCLYDALAALDLGVPGQPAGSRDPTSLDRSR